MNLTFEMNWFEAKLWNFFTKKQKSYTWIVLLWGENTRVCVYFYKSKTIDSSRSITDWNSFSLAGFYLKSTFKESNYLNLFKVPLREDQHLYAALTWWRKKTGGRNEQRASSADNNTPQIHSWEKPNDSGDRKLRSSRYSEEKHKPVSYLSCHPQTIRDCCPVSLAPFFSAGWEDYSSSVRTEDVNRTPSR